MVDPGLTALGFRALRRKCDEPPSNFAFTFNLRHYIVVAAMTPGRAAMTPGRTTMTPGRPTTQLQSAHFSPLAPSPLAGGSLRSSTRSTLNISNLFLILRTSV
jgi:hypothetical protein